MARADKQQRELAKGAGMRHGGPASDSQSLPFGSRVAMHFVSGASSRHHARLGEHPWSSCLSSSQPLCRCCAALPPAAHEGSSASSVEVPRAAGDTRSLLRVRKATWGDVQSVAKLCAAAFVEVPGAVPAAPQVEGWAEYLESRYQESMAREVRQAVGLALTRKVRLFASRLALTLLRRLTQHTSRHHVGGRHRQM